MTHLAAEQHSFIGTKYVVSHWILSHIVQQKPELDHREVFFPPKRMCPLNMLISPEHTDLVLLGLLAHCTVTVTFEMRHAKPSTVEEAEDTQHLIWLLSTSPICAG